MDRHSRQAAGASRAAPPPDVPGASPGSVAAPDLLAELILATGRGDARAFRRLYDGASPILLGLLMRKLGRRDLAEDALQECFIKIWQKAATYDPARGDCHRMAGHTGPQPRHRCAAQAGARGRHG